MSIVRSLGRCAHDVLVDLHQLLGGTDTQASGEEFKRFSRAVGSREGYVRSTPGSIQTIQQSSKLRLFAMPTSGSVKP